MVLLLLQTLLAFSTIVVQVEKLQDKSRGPAPLFLYKRF
jgi:hypothetical protein